MSQADLPSSESNALPVVAPLICVLQQLLELLQLIEQDQYIARPEATACGAIAGHTRHTIDHVQALLHAANGDVVDYENRARDTLIEQDLNVAKKALVAQISALTTLAQQVLSRSVQVHTCLEASGQIEVMPSTWQRELAFVFSHTVHHNALVGAIAAVQGIARPAGFGLAPSTAHFRKQQAG